jgi:hypothetical protein
VRSDFTVRAVRVESYRPQGQPSPAGLPDFKEPPMSHPNELPIRPTNLDLLEEMDHRLRDVISRAALFTDLLVSKDGKIEVDADGLYLTFQSIRNDCDAAHAALDKLRPIALRQGS